MAIFNSYVKLPEGNIAIWNMAHLYVEIPWILLAAWKNGAWEPWFDVR